MLRAALITLGDPLTLTGGYLFHRRLAELAPRHDASIEFVSVPDRPFPIGLLDADSIVVRLRELTPDVIVLDSIAAAFFAFARFERPVVGMLHQPPGGIDHGPARSRLQAVLDRQTYRRVGWLLVASESLAEDFRRQFPLKDVRVVPPGRDVATELGPSPGDVRRGRRAALLSVGNWVERKGILTLVNALAHVDDATLHLVGDTRAQPRYATRVWARLAQPDVTDKVIVHGPLSIGQVAALYASADVFVLPSLKEPYGTVYGEAMTFGLPVIGWRAGNLPYLADHEREGLLVSPGDVGGLSTAIQRLVDDEPLRMRLGEAAKARAIRRPTWDEVADLFFGHLREVAGSAVKAA